ncbi:MAG: hypothetical protein ACI4TZ_00980 [Christensenellales bacterium]
MKFLKWLINFKSRHHMDIERYEKGKLSTKIFLIILMCAFVGATLAIEYWCIDVFNTNIFCGFLVLILLVAIAAGTIESLVLYSYIGFRMFIWGTIESIAQKIDDKKAKQKNQDIVLTNETNESEDCNKGENTICENNEPSLAENNEQNKNLKNTQKAHKWIDLLVCICCIALCIGLVVGMIMMVVSQ